MPIGRRQALLVIAVVSFAIPVQVDGNVLHIKSFITLIANVKQVYSFKCSLIPYWIDCSIFSQSGKTCPWLVLLGRQFTGFENNNSNENIGNEGDDWCQWFCLREKVPHFAWFRLERLIDWLEDVADGAARYFIPQKLTGRELSASSAYKGLSHFCHLREATEEGHTAFQVFRILPSFKYIFPDSQEPKFLAKIFLLML